MSFFNSILSKIVDYAQAATSSGSEGSASGAGSSAPVDVDGILKNLMNKSQEVLNYKVSIVDLLKLLGLDSSLDARKKLAQELNYPGDPNDTSAMNTWLIKQVYTKLSQNGGKIPEGWGH